MTTRPSESAAPEQQQRQQQRQQDQSSPTTWVASVDGFGALQPPLEFAGLERQGNYRIRCGDTLIAELPAGSLVNQKDPRLVIIDGVGNETTLTGTADVLGSKKFVWKTTPSCVGPCTLMFDYVPFPALELQASSECKIAPERKSGLLNYVIVEPKIMINSKEIHLNSLSMQTALSRCLGRLDTWPSKVKYATADMGYNVIHFTPVQLTGESGSCYSLADQLEISPELLPPGTTDGWAFLKSVITELETVHNIMSTSDIVLNHTANDTHWIPAHPECGYNEIDYPHLNGAIELDNALQAFSSRIAEGKYTHDGLSPLVERTSDLQTLTRLLQRDVIDKFRMVEWFQIDHDASIADFKKRVSAAVPTHQPYQERLELLMAECLLTVGVARRHGVVPRGSVTRLLFHGLDEYRRALHTIQGWLNDRAAKANASIVNAIQGFVRWERIQCRKGPIMNSHWNAIVPRYFTPVTTNSGSILHLANNGWVMDWDSSVDFAAPGSLVYLDRSLIVWSDCIKLRYGENPEDNPFLWDLMKEYCRRTASVFHGIRLDNCHSTPIHVAKACLMEARKVNPNLWLYAELFTGEREADLMFARELGLNALIREAMQSHNAGSLAYHAQEYGGQRIGSLSPFSCLKRVSEPNHRPLIPTLSPSLFFDCTHDNETPKQKRTAADALPNAAIVAASVCPIGSTRGYDELVSHVLSVVSEYRHYHHYGPSTESATGSDDIVINEANQRAMKITTSLRAGSNAVVVKGSWDGWQKPVALSRRHGVWTGEVPAEYLPEGATKSVDYQFKFIAESSDWFIDPQLPTARDGHGNMNNVVSVGNNLRDPTAGGNLIDPSQWTVGKPLPGIMEGRKVLNALHVRLGSEGFSEVDTETIGEDIVIIIRHNPQTHQMCYFFVHTAFTPAVLSHPSISRFSYEIQGKVEEVILEAFLTVEETSQTNKSSFINGLPSRLYLSSHHRDLESRLHSFTASYEERSDRTTFQFNAFGPGSVLIVMTAGYRHIRESVENSIAELTIVMQDITSTKTGRQDELQAYSYLLFSSGNEERDRSKGLRGCYSLETIGELPYAGFCGLVPLLDRIRYTGDRSHPLIKNVMSGNWLFEYLSDRLDSDKDDAFSGGVLVLLLKAAGWLRETSAEPLRYLPRKLLPYYLDWIVSFGYGWCAQRLMTRMEGPLKGITDPFIIRLALATLQFYSFVPSSPLVFGTKSPSLSAGLPHFTVGYMRNWGRDTFIAIKGCLLSVGRYAEARAEILGFATVMRHGLIPNLLDSGNNPRYNARDATWYFLQAIQDYCSRAPEGLEFLKTEIALKYSDVLHAGSHVKTLADLIHFIMRQHAHGIEFREWNAGKKIDSVMKDEGFDINITFDPETGMIFGGNRFNCGTWMDKMGSSHEAGTVGIPASPRDGAAVELIGLLKSTLRFICSLPSTHFKYTVANEEIELTYARWNELVQESFERCFYVCEESVPPQEKKLINRMNVLKDTYKSSETWRDYQLRPNCPIALAVAPELLPSAKALPALRQVSSILFSATPPEVMMERLDDLKLEFGPSAQDIARNVEKYFEKALCTIQLGLKTLDPSDYNYRPNYRNDDRSTDPSVSAGFNYHNGPEWVWPVGYFLDSLFTYIKQLDISATSALDYAKFLCMTYLLSHRRWIATDVWASFPEVMDDGGQRCSFSCHAQAWSIGTVVGFLENVAAVSSPPTTSTVPSSQPSQAAAKATPAETLVLETGGSPAALSVPEQ